MIELTTRQRQALNENGVPPKLRDPETNTTYVLVREDVYARLEGLLGEGLNPAEAYPAIDGAFAAGWNAPGMEDYDRYEDLRHERKQG